MSIIMVCSYAEPCTEGEKGLMIYGVEQKESGTGVVCDYVACLLKCKVEIEQNVMKS